METLRKLLSDTGNEDLQVWFQTIANELMCNHVIQKGKCQYAVVEIEFYYYSPEHRDVITYPRQMEAGRWFFHQSGVDLTFDSFDIKFQDGKFELGKNAQFGGILIRGLRKLNHEKYIFGPQRCVNELWDNFDAFGTTAEMEYPVLKEHKAVASPNLRACKRHIAIKKEIQPVKKVEEWAGRLGLGLSDIGAYEDDLFNNPTKYLYRYFNLPEYSSSILNNIPSNARPKDLE